MIITFGPRAGYRGTFLAILEALLCRLMSVQTPSLESNQEGLGYAEYRPIGERAVSNGGWSILAERRNSTVFCRHEERSLFDEKQIRRR